MIDWLSTACVTPVTTEKELPATGARLCRQIAGLALAITIYQRVTTFFVWQSRATEWRLNWTCALRSSFSACIASAFNCSWISYFEIFVCFNNLLVASLVANINLRAPLAIMTAWFLRIFFLSGWTRDNIAKWYAGLDGLDFSCSATIHMSPYTISGSNQNLTFSLRLSPENDPSQTKRAAVAAYIKTWGKHDTNVQEIFRLSHSLTAAPQNVK